MSCVTMLMFLNMAEPTHVQKAKAKFNYTLVFLTETLFFSNLQNNLREILILPVHSSHFSCYFDFTLSV